MSQLDKVVSILFLISICLSNTPTLSSGWNKPNSTYNYQVINRLTSEMINDQRVLTSKQETTNNIAIRMVSYDGTTVHYIVKEVDIINHLILLGESLNYFKNSSCHAPSLLITDKKINFGYEVNYSAVERTENDERRTYLTFFAISLTPLFFVEPYWSVYRFLLYNWFAPQRLFWSSFNFAESHDFSLLVNDNEIFIDASFPYIQSVYIGYIPPGLEGLFGSLSSYAETKGTVSQNIALKYDTAGLLLSFSSSLKINLPGKASLQVENIIRLSTGATKTNSALTFGFIAPGLFLIVLLFIFSRKRSVIFIKKVKGGEK